MHLPLLILIALHGLGASAAAAATAAPSVELEAGTLTGGRCDSSPNAVFFKSVPYALPPLGPRRFAAPQPYNLKYPGGKLNAITPAPACIQFGEEFAEKGPQSENCLLLDIWKPANATRDSALPVRVWIYGGSNTGGGVSDPLYDGCGVVSSDAIMVSINYRLGPLGFLGLESAGLEGNYGISDILLGLEWVQENIAAFGGDPKKVLLHGQSAGAVNGFVVATLPQAPRLISAGAFQSGGGRDSPLKGTAEELGKAFVGALNCGAADASCVRNASVAELQQVFGTLPLLNSAKYPDLSVSTILSQSFEPFVDGKVVPYQPSSAGVKVPSIFGSNALDGTLFPLGEFATASNPFTAVNASVYTEFLTENFGASAAKTIEELLPLSAFNNTLFPAFYAVSEVITAFQYQCPAMRGLDMAVANGVPVWSYVFGTKPSCSWLPSVPSEILPIIGSAHTAEIPFILGETTQLPLPNGTCTMTTVEQGLSQFMKDAWSMMAASQMPTAETSAWPRYERRQDGPGLNITSAATPGPMNSKMCTELWDKINQNFRDQAYNRTSTAKRF